MDVTASKRDEVEMLRPRSQEALARDARARQQRAPIEGARARFDTLTAREREVLEHVLRGQLNKEMAGDLGIHERTVKLHRHHEQGRRPVGPGADASLTEGLP